MWRWFVLALVVGMTAALFVGMRGGDTVPTPPPSRVSEDAAPKTGADVQPPAQYVGATACAACHAAEEKAWRGSQHARAMARADANTVLGDFAGTHFTHAGVTSTFFEREGKYFVNTDGPDGRLADFEIKYTFGVEPLQQYLIELPGGRMQALGIAWDSRTREAGGQHWFHLYPDQNLKAGDPLHWAGIDQNWNYQCADCHSTNLRKNYDPHGLRFATTWSEINVSCEACHGPGSNHVSWASKADGWQRFESGKGLTASLDERKDSVWVMNSDTGTAVRSMPRSTQREIEVCARCHARRGQFADEYSAGQPFHDAFRPVFIEPGLYHPDGQQLDEVYTYASFLQSRMHAQGVTCSDCHEPHGGKPRAAGNAVCLQCHAGTKYDAMEHTHHAQGSAGSSCIACHMPTTTYMVNDPRHDHSFRIPRPDRSVSMGTPNACIDCHADKDAAWAAAAVRRWFPHPKPGYQTFAETFHAADTDAGDTRKLLTAIVADPSQSAIARASALARLSVAPSAAAIDAAAGACKDADANVRMAAVAVLASADMDTRLRYLPGLLNDAVRTVRMDAARALAGEPEARLPAASRASFARALDEYVAAQHFNADRPEANTHLGGLRLVQGQFAEAEVEFQRALQLDPAFIPAAVNLADLYRAQGRDGEAEAVLRAALGLNPDAAVLHHTLGLALVRQQRMTEALTALAKAMQLAPGDVRFAYVYAIALHDTRQPVKAIETLQQTLERQPDSREILSALVSYEQEAGRQERAADYLRRLKQLENESRPKQSR